MQYLYSRIHSDPKFHELEKKRGLFSWILVAIVLLGYYAFIMVIAFSPELFAIPITENSVIPWGIPIGLCVIIASFLLTGVYVYRANSEFDQLSQAIVEDALNNHQASD